MRAERCRSLCLDRGASLQRATVRWPALSSELRVLPGASTHRRRRQACRSTPACHRGVTREIPLPRMRLQRAGTGFPRTPLRLPVLTHAPHATACLTGPPYRAVHVRRVAVGAVVGSGVDSGLPRGRAVDARRAAPATQRTAVGGQRVADTQVVGRGAPTVVAAGSNRGGRRAGGGGVGGVESSATFLL